jgi:hypothetical protein
MSLDALGDDDECVARVRFVPEGKGLVTRFQSPDSDARFGPSQEEHRRKLSIAAELSEYHGIITFPVRLPRYLMPEWSQDDWSEFVDSEIGFFHGFVEAVVQGLSLALVADTMHSELPDDTLNEIG